MPEPALTLLQCALGPLALGDVDGRSDETVDAVH